MYMPKRSQSLMFFCGKFDTNLLRLKAKTRSITLVFFLVLQVVPQWSSILRESSGASGKGAAGDSLCSQNFCRVLIV